MRRSAAIVLLLGLGSVVACQGFATNDIGYGLGASCDNTDQCQGSKCIGGVCTIACASNKCPSGMGCFKDFVTSASLCQIPLSVGFVYPGDPMQEAFTESFANGRSTLLNNLKYVSPSQEVPNAFLAGQANQAATALLEGGYKVVVVSSRSVDQTDESELVTQAAKHPNAQLLVLGSHVANSNITSFDVRTYQGYYLAGIEAGRATQKNRLGMIGSVYSPSVVASINAFVLGAQSVNDKVVVEVRWIGDYHDPNANPGKTLERVYTEDLMTAGADVIAHTLDNNISVTTVADEGTPGTVSISANSQDGCGQPAVPSCVGSIYYNWAPILTTLIDDYHKQNVPQRLLASIDVTDSPIEFQISHGSAIDSLTLEEEIDSAKSRVAADGGVSSVFKGPITSTGQCEAKTGTPMCVPDGKTLDDQGLADMCWFVQGIVEKDATNVDQPAMVPEMGDCTPTK